MERSVPVRMEASKRGKRPDLFFFFFFFSVTKAKLYDGFVFLTDERTSTRNVTEKPISTRSFGECANVG